ncbi:8-oxo-dGTP pyrophosphatase MutT (NUDIX family) [Actinoplanes octamycinicus]|uniref:8-oxo-dGTP pyrophosphatase MutT (NUDIX family) n=1 Tax=Actinoplanes octamycinicus TaxID=135948 RepID=A0A7W7GSW7_9ACTN|nr:NUDIX domain-containing protein [Actinoplanes octamycinicus]MBB4737690.1 8-oxo-dGTP pyrophosphatase MutT (NUDIX family) [Actinoplanes octamycinicus]GIE57993.1 hypothetical protein Aoc01nite_33950 [Actinoplanes octamycinicus]
MKQIACTFLVGVGGALLLQLRDDKAPYYPDVWGLPGGAIEDGETPGEAAARELWEEAQVRAEGELTLFARQELPAEGRVKHYFFGRTTATQADVVLGEGAAMVFVPGDEVPGRPFTPGTAEMIARFLDSEEYRAAVAGAA